MDDKTAYLTHPVAAEIKKAVNREGHVIIDAVFAPDGAKIIDGQTGEPIPAEKPARGKKAE